MIEDARRAGCQTRLDGRMCCGKCFPIYNLEWACQEKASSIPAAPEVGHVAGATPDRGSRTRLVVTWLAQSEIDFPFDL
jgi:hypothetical protein